MCCVGRYWRDLGRDPACGLWTDVVLQGLPAMCFGETGWRLGSAWKLADWLEGHSERVLSVHLHVQVRFHVIRNLWWVTTCCIYRRNL